MELKEIEYAHEKCIPVLAEHGFRYRYIKDCIDWELVFKGMLNSMWEADADYMRFWFENLGVGYMQIHEYHDGEWVRVQ